MSADLTGESWRAAVAAFERTSTNQTSNHEGRTMTTPLPEPTEEALGAALIAIRRARLPWYVRLVLPKHGTARHTLARETAARVERTVTARVREETTQRINESWFEALHAGEEPAGAAESLCATQSAESGSGDREDAQAANGAHSTTEEPGTGHSSPEAPGTAHSATETPSGAPAASESLSDEQSARGASEGRPGAKAPRSVARPMLTPMRPERRPALAATVDPAMCPRCKGDNSEPFDLCDGCKDEIDLLQQETRNEACDDDA